MTIITIGDAEHIAGAHDPHAMRIGVAVAALAEGTRDVTRVWAGIKTLNSDEWGATMVEYSLAVGLIAILSILVVGALGVDVFGQFDGAQASFTDPMPGAPTP